MSNIKDSHKAKCICQICSCGRHVCPQKKNRTSNELQTIREGSFQSKKPINFKENAKTVVSQERAPPESPSPPPEANPQVASIVNSNATIGKHERAKPIKPKESHVLKQEGAFQSRTSNQDSFSHSRGDRFETKKPKDSDVLKREGNMETRTSNKESVYNGPITKPEKGRKPQDSNILRGEGEFPNQSLKQEEFKLLKKEKSLSARPKDTANILQRKDSNAEINKTTSKETNLDAKKLIKGDRYETKKPQDSNVLKHEGEFEKSTTNSEMFKHGPVERGKAKKPQDSNLLRGTGDLDSSWHIRKQNEPTTHPTPCYGGKLLESLKFDRPTSKYEFRKEKDGHRFFHPVPMAPASITT